MNRFFYDLSLQIYSIAIRLASPFVKKAKLLHDGRKQVWEELDKERQHFTDKIAWFHNSSFGEFEQAKPLIEEFKSQFADYQILITFFSPSGYEQCKDYEGADFVFYLPGDSSSNAQKFIELTRPKIAFFVLYEFWYHYFHELSRRDIPLISFSTIFREGQIYFRNNFYQSILENVTHFFVQNENSIQLLKSIGITGVTQSGDTRFERVKEVAEASKSIPWVDEFIGDAPVLVIGSSWPKDIEVLSYFIENHPEIKYLIAPHNLDETTLSHIENTLTLESIRYTEVNESVIEKNILIVNTMGMLSTLYRYGHVAYVGGSFGKGLHNILEAAVYGVPILFGDHNYKKFQEALDLIEAGSAHAIGNATDLSDLLEMYFADSDKRALAREKSTAYIDSGLGATQLILDHCEQKGFIR